MNRDAPDVASYDEEYFRRLYGEVPEQSRFDRGRDARIARLVERYATPADGRALLDVGCGLGYLLERFRGRFGLFGVELSGHAGPLAARRLPQASIVQADVQRRLPFREAFDVVLAVNVIEHLADPEAAVAGMRAILRPGGLCVVHLPTINGPVSRAVYRLFYAGDPTHVYRPSGRDVGRLFERHGFETLHHSHAPHVPGWLWRAVRWNPAFLAAFRRR